MSNSEIVDSALAMQGKSESSNGGSDGNAAETFLVEKDKKLSESVIWSLLEQYYDSASISAWNEIPFYPTSNPFIADTYAQLIVSFLRDYFEKLDLSKPVYIVEMAAGSGCFSFYLLKELKRKIEFFSSLKQIDLRYIMADFTANNVRSWMSSEKLRPFAESGMLSFGIFRPETDRKIVRCKLSDDKNDSPSAYSDEEVLLAAGMSPNPVIAIANYFFDSIKNDAFQIHNGLLKEVRQTFHCVRDSEQPNQIKFDRLIKAEQIHDASYDYYDDARFNRVLNNYSRQFENASILFPWGALNCIANLFEMSGDNLLLISSDKGFNDKTYIEGRREQPFLPHHGIFSYSVNYDAIGRFFRELGGISMNTSDDNLSVSTAVNLLVKNSGDGNSSFEELSYCFDQWVDRQNTCNYLYFIQDLLTEIQPKKGDNASEILRACLGYIQLCNYDPIVFCLAAPRIYMALETINVLQEKRLLEIIERVNDNFYSVQQQYDVFYWIGRIYYGLNRLDDALRAFSDSMLTFGSSSSTTYYVAACYEVRKDYETALRYYEDTLAMEPSCPFTQDGLKRVRAIIKP